VRQRSLCALLAGSLGLLAPAAYADKSTELYVRLSAVKATISGGSSTAASNTDPDATTSSGGSFMAMPSLDVEYQIFNSSKSSYCFRMVLSPDMASGKVKYLYGGVGQRFYLSSQGLAWSVSEKNVSFKMSPGIRYFVGWDAGLAQITVLERGTVLQVGSTLVDVGVSGGATYQMGDSFGLNAGATAAFGYGFSNVAVTAILFKVFFGGNYFF